ncbi:MAG: prephenate dehydrogenase/arogenate dehydrogenase family protein [Candidatus Abyssobacteria bacterium SURF_5]|uniref:Prephenate dehydrogenase/arogenate dehydrogenase family protein n=1 Tax=Abyssobacteria bacterium (strain SURF_5) TaxID=2093360 RepID=A0A3A4P201_ABYX5|nr:MAG: prephenate dehydrogenase/arogenate dehydrogenase family protein [Candidatus Abyssubacteria bacterium SURF_5]
MNPFFEKVAIIGVGLIGGSIGLALKKRGLCGSITGLGRSHQSLANAAKAGAIDEAAPDIPEAVNGADLVVVCTPVGSVAGVIAEMDSSLEENAYVTDVGSTKLNIVRAVEELPRASMRYVGSHPLAGSDRKGAAHASADLFEGAAVFVTPTLATNPQVNETIQELWARLGAKVVEVAPEAHDRIVARTSHLPHIAASLLVAGLRTLSPEDNRLVGKGFLDTTRIAASDPEMWTEICLENIEEIREAMATLREDMEEFDLYLSEGSYEKLFEFFRSVKIVRDSFDS